MPATLPEFAPLATLSWARGLPVPEKHPQLLWVLPAAKQLPADLPARAQWLSVLKRREVKLAALAKTAQALDLPGGGRMVLVMVDPQQTPYARLATLRGAASLLLDESPSEVALVVEGELALARDALYTLWLNGVPLPARGLALIHYFGPGTAADFVPVHALAAANTLVRCLTALPPNVLTPTDYRQRVRTLAKALDWQHEEYDFRKLQKIGAGAFCAVAQGSDERGEGGGAAIVHLRHRPPGARLKLALVGKGICFDTGGHYL